MLEGSMREHVLPCKHTIHLCESLKTQMDGSRGHVHLMMDEFPFLTVLLWGFAFFLYENSLARNTVPKPCPGEAFRL